MRQRVLVTDGDQRSALACVRSLAAAGFDCFVIGPERGSLAGVSRSCRGHGTWADPADDPEAFLDGLVEKVEQWRIDVLLPITEKSLRAVLPAVHKFPGVEVPFPSYEVFERVSDKARVLAAAGEVGIGVPKQWEWESFADTKGINMAEIEFPLVIKPTRSVPNLGDGRRHGAVTYVTCSDDLRLWLEEAGEESFPVLVQERVDGEGAGVFVLLWKGVLRGVVGHRRIREKPPSGGVSVMRESTFVETGLLEQSLALLKELGLESGVAMVEYKVDPESGRSWLMEINGRFWGSLQMALDAGVDFPALLLQCVLGGLRSDLVTGTSGVRTRWLLGDLDHLLMRMMRSREALNLPSAFPGKFRALMDFLLDFRPGIRLEVLRLSDPLPFLVEARAWLRALRS